MLNLVVREETARIERLTEWLEPIEIVKKDFAV
jgi:hypothetical protein